MKRPVNSAHRELTGRFLGDSNEIKKSPSYRE